MVIPSLNQAIAKALEISSGYTLFDSETGVAGAKRPDGSVHVRFVQYDYVEKTGQKKPCKVLLVSFTRSGVKKQLLSTKAKSQDEAAIAKNARMCRAVAKAYVEYHSKHGSYTKFDVQAKEFARDAQSWEDEKQKYEYRYWVRIMPYEPGSSFSYRLSKDYKVVGVLPGT